MVRHILFSLFLIICLVWIPIIVTQAHAILKLESVNPAPGEIGRDLEVTLKGTGFDEDTRVSISLDAGNKRTIIGSVETLGDARNIVVAGNTAYVVDGVGLRIIDISDSNNPQIIGALEVPAADVTVMGDHAYVVNRYIFQIVNVRDPQNPMIVGSLVTPGWTESVTVYEDIAYVTDSFNGGLYVINISEPQNPKIIGSLVTPGWAESVSVVGNVVYLAASGTGWGALQIVNVSDPSIPVLVGSVDTPGSASCVTVVDDTAYVANTSRGLQVIDVSDPQNPWTIGWVQTPGSAEAVIVDGDVAYVADGAGLQIIDISNFLNLQIIGAVGTPGYAHDVAISDDLAYVADSKGGLQVIDVSHPQTLPLVGRIGTPGRPFDVTVYGDTAYVADGNGGLQIVDVKTASEPKIIGSVYISPDARAVTIVETIAYVADGGGGIQVVDISNPLDPMVIGWINTPGIVSYDVEVRDDLAYVADGEGGLQVIDVSSPETPIIIGAVITPGNAISVAVVGDFAYVADGSEGLQIIDIGDPYNPRIIGTADTPGYAYDVKLSGNLAYVADSGGGLQVVEVSSLESPQIIGEIETPGFAKGIKLVGNTAYVAERVGGVQLVDIADPTALQIVGSVDTPGWAEAIDVAGGLGYVADREAGLIVVPLPVEIESVTVNSAESISVTLPGPSIAGHYTVRVFNKTENDDLNGAVTFFDPDRYSDLEKKKAIIVAGYNDKPEDPLKPLTWKCANTAYLALMTQGYRSTDWNNINFLSPEAVDLDGDGISDATTVPTLGNLAESINSWAQGADDLLLYMTDHGGTGTFSINEDEILKAADLDGWLDDFQLAADARVILIYDACMSGSFIPLLTPPAGKERIIITSSKADEDAWFQNYGVLSFSYQFWAHIQADSRLSKAFSTASEMMKEDQTALLDANDDGIANQEEDLMIADILIGRGLIAAATPPEIGNVSEDQTLYLETSTSFLASNVIGIVPVERVWAVIIPPDYRDPSQPAIEFDSIDLFDADQDGVYEGTYPNFTNVGTYLVLVYAQDADDVISLPRKIIVHKTGPDQYEFDNSPDMASILVIDNSSHQHHNFHDIGDEDWLKFDAIAGKTYTIKAFKLGLYCNVVIELYNTDGTSLLAIQNNDTDPGAEERLDWICPQTGTYYVKYRQYPPETFGVGTEYDLKIDFSQAACMGDFDGDDDVDGKDLADFNLNSRDIGIRDFAVGFGKTDCSKAEP